MEDRGWSEARVNREHEKLRVEIYHFQFPKMHLLSHLTESICQMGSPNNFSTDVSELLHVEMVNEAYRSTNRVNFEEQILWYNDRYTGLAYMIQTLEYLAFRGSLDSDTARTLRMSSQEERHRSTRHARRRQAAACSQLSGVTGEAPKPQSVPFYTPLAVPEARARPGINELLRQTVLARREKSRKPLSLGEAATRFDINDFPAIFRQQIVAIWGSHLTKRVLGPGKTFVSKVRIEIYNSVLNFYQPFQRPLEVQKWYLRCVRWGDGKRPGVTHNVWVRVSQDRTQDTFQGRKVCAPVLYFGYTPPRFAAELCGPEGQRVETRPKPRSKQGRKHEVMVPKTLELAVLVGYRFTGSAGKPNRYHGCVEVELDSRDLFVAEMGSIKDPVQLVEVNEVRQSRKTWIVNNHIDLETDYYVY